MDIELEGTNVEQNAARDLVSEVGGLRKGITLLLEDRVKVNDFINSINAQSEEVRVAKAKEMEEKEEEEKKEDMKKALTAEIFGQLGISTEEGAGSPREQLAKMWGDGATTAARGKGNILGEAEETVETEGSSATVIKMEGEMKEEKKSKKDDEEDDKEAVAKAKLEEAANLLKANGFAITEVAKGDTAPDATAPATTDSTPGAAPAATTDAPGGVIKGSDDIEGNDVETLGGNPEGSPGVQKSVSEEIPLWQVASIPHAKALGLIS